MVDLDFVPTDDLIQGLLSRFDEAVFVGDSRERGGTVDLHWSGSVSAARGWSGLAYDYFADNMRIFLMTEPTRLGNDDDEEA